MTVFIRNAAYLTHKQLKALRFTNGNKSFDFLKSVPARAPQKRRFLGACSASRALTSQYFSEATSMKKTAQKFFFFIVFNFFVLTSMHT
jgi:hypothetical protein